MLKHIINKNNKLIITLLVLLFISNTSYSNHWKEKTVLNGTHKTITKELNKNIDPFDKIVRKKIKKNEAIFFVNGIVCSFCSLGIRKKLSKLKFIDKSKYKKGSKINVKKQRVKMAFKKDKKIDIDLIYHSIQSGGYDPLTAYIADKNREIIKYSFKKK